MPPAKPELKVEDITSEAALDKHDIAVEDWGNTMYRQLGRVCRYFAPTTPGLKCPPAI